MAKLANGMPPIKISKQELRKWGKLWLGGGKKKESFGKKQSMDFGLYFDGAFAESLASMLGGIPVKRARSGLLPPIPDCVEVGPVTIIGGVRPQNFDVGYRPDGPRVVFDSKTLNDIDSVRKNWQNMINDLATEATTVHTRFPYAVVAFIVVIPGPALAPTQQTDITRTLERLGTRKDVLDQSQLAEGIAFVVWNPKTGDIDDSIPPKDSNLRIEDLSVRLYPHYLNRYKGLPPHNEARTRLRTSK